jgi:hypothetical protein
MDFSNTGESRNGRGIVMLLDPAQIAMVAIVARVDA